MSDLIVLTRFPESNEGSNWVAINDVVMGGVSSSRFRIGPEFTGIFEGTLSLENNGGFASVRTFPAVNDLSEAKGIRIRVRGDGRDYRLRLHTNRNFDGVAYQSQFGTVPEEWVEIELPFGSFRPTYRGRPVSGYDPLNTSAVEQMGLMIADRKPGRFRLEVAWIAAYGKEKNHP